MILLQVLIHCDQPGCDASLTWRYHNESGGNTSSALMMARRRGWAASLASAKCPKHRKALATHAFVPGRYFAESCEHRVGRGECGKDEDHPIHAH